LLKSRLEVEKRRTFDRAVLQLQVLSEQFVDTSPSVSERMQYFFLLQFYPARPLLDKELGLQFLKIGMAQSALNIFEKLEMWDEIVMCFRVMQQEKKAIEVVRKRLQEDETPELWCLLGDLTKTPDYFKKSWKVSNKRYARAMRYLGDHNLRQQNYVKAISCYEKALKINTLYPNTWFCYGCSCLKCAEWQKAMNAFGRVVQIEPDNPEAWSNLHAVFRKLNRNRDAFNALQQGLKYSFSNWRMWDNYFTLALELEEFQTALHALEKLLSLSKQEIPIQFVAFLVDGILIKKNEGNFIARVEKVLEEICLRFSQEHRYWQIFAAFYKELKK